jgi:hypothetical protein
MPVPLRQRTVCGTRNKHRHHLRRGAIHTARAVDEEPRAAGLTGVSTGRVTRAPHIATALARANRAVRSVAIGQKKPRVDTDLVAVVFPCDQVAAGSVLPRVANVVGRPATSWGIWVGVSGIVKPTSGFGARVDAWYAKLKYVVNHTPVFVRKSYSCTHIVRPSGLQACR